jgi:hypothetical protein
MGVSGGTWLLAISETPTRGSFTYQFGFPTLGLPDANRINRHLFGFEMAGNRLTIRIEGPIATARTQQEAEAAISTG